MKNEQNAGSETRTNSEETTSSDKNFFQHAMKYFAKYKPVFWNLILLGTGLYLIWHTMSVLLTILGFLVGIFFVFFALSELNLLHPMSVVNLLMRMLRTK